jgi:hypothetical protein
MDPWYPLRAIKEWVLKYCPLTFQLTLSTLSLYHPRTALSSTNLTHRAFFSKEYPVEKVLDDTSTLTCPPGS